MELILEGGFPLWGNRVVVVVVVVVPEKLRGRLVHCRHMTDILERWRYRQWRAHQSGGQSWTLPSNVPSVDVRPFTLPSHCVDVLN